MGWWEPQCSSAKHCSSAYYINTNTATTATHLKLIITRGTTIICTRTNSSPLCPSWWDPHQCYSTQHSSWFFINTKSVPTEQSAEWKHKKSKKTTNSPIVQEQHHLMMMFVSRHQHFSLLRKMRLQGLFKRFWHVSNTRAISLGWGDSKVQQQRPQYGQGMHFELLEW